MSALKPDNRQYQLSAEAVVGFADFVGAVAVEIFELPQGAVITNLKVFVDTAFSGGTTHDFNLGDIIDPNRYSQTIIEADAAGTPVNDADLAFAAGRATTGAEPNVLFSPVSTGGDPSAGSLRVYIEYYLQGRTNENQG